MEIDDLHLGLIDQVARSQAVLRHLRHNALLCRKNQVRGKEKIHWSTLTRAQPDRQLPVSGSTQIVTLMPTVIINKHHQQASLQPPAPERTSYVVQCLRTGHPSKYASLKESFHPQSPTRPLTHAMVASSANQPQAEDSEAPVAVKGTNHNCLSAMIPSTQMKAITSFITRGKPTRMRCPSK